MIKVVVVDDSPTARELVRHILDSAPDIKVIGTAADGEEAVRVVCELRPDVVTMDINMPRMNGFEATRQIMEKCPTPLIVVSASWNIQEMRTTFDVMEAGALAIVSRPVGAGHPDFDSDSHELVHSVRAMSEVKVVRRWARLRDRISGPGAVPAARVTRPEPAQLRIVAVGASTGGPYTLQTILALLTDDFPLPVAIVQHMTPGFIRGFAEWLDRTCKLRVLVASHGDHLLSGYVYVAPDGFHMQIAPGDKVELVEAEPDNGLRPAVSFLFRSVAQVFGDQAVGVLLSGMGKDGARELGLMKERGAITIAQDKESSVVHGMPGEAISLGAAALVLPPAKIAATLMRLAPKKRE